MYPAYDPLPLEEGMHASKLGAATIEKLGRFDWSGTSRHHTVATYTRWGCIRSLRRAERKWLRGQQTRETVTL